MIKKSFFITFFAILLFSQNVFATQQIQEVNYFASLRSNETNIRSGPGSNYPVKFTFKLRNLPVKIVSEYDNWCKSDKPNDIPTHADRCKQYQTEWNGWEDYLGCKINNTSDMKLSDKQKIKIVNLYNKILKQNNN